MSYKNGATKCNKICSAPYYNTKKCRPGLVITKKWLKNYLINFSLLYNDEQLIVMLEYGHFESNSKNMRERETVELTVVI